MRSIRNPFTPSFGGLPEYFAGRTDLIRRVENALEDAGSPDRALFLTGCRGSGKTALLERLSICAREGHWYTIDVHSSHAESSIQNSLDSMGLVGKVQITPSVSLPGVQLKGEGSIRKEASDSALTERLVDACGRLSGHNGIFITIDEVQKIAESDMEEVCSAVQMARRKGLPVSLVLAGLPRSKELVASYGGCTFMQRVEDVRIGGLLVRETVEAFRDQLGLIPDLKVDDDVVESLANMSQGYPYLIQLVGYCFVKSLAEAFPVGVVCPSADDAAVIEDEVYETYRRNVLMPSTKGLRREALQYMRAVARLQDDEGFTRTSDIAHELGKQQKQLSTCRKSLVERRLILPVGHGKVCFGLPYLTRFSLEKHVEEGPDLRGRWVPR
jgi:hypothetical protein